MLTEGDFQKALEVVLGHEGGYVDNPADPGGATNFGVTQATYDAWRTDQGLPTQSVQAIGADEVAAIYRDNYWTASGAPNLAYPMALVHFDTAVNMGVVEANKILARSGTSVDAYLADRKAVYGEIVANKPALEPFLAGWLKRVEQLAAQAKGGVALGTIALLVLGALYWWWRSRSTA